MSDPTRSPANAIPVFLAPAQGSQTVNIPTSTNTLVYTGAGYVTGISVNTGGTTSTLKLYDGTDDTGTLLGTWSTTAQNSLPVSLPFETGLFAVTAGVAPADVTLSYVEG